MALADTLRDILATPTETTTLDFKEVVNWPSTRAKLELARDIVCLANRSGGLLVVGVADRGNGHWEAVGLADGDALPDGTELGTFVGNYFAPPPLIEVHQVPLDGRGFGVIKVEEFSRFPHVCHRVGNDETNTAVFRPGDFFRRSAAMACHKIDSADEVREVFEAGVSKIGAAVRTMVGEPVETPRVPETATWPEPIRRVAGQMASAEERETLRTCDLIPVAAPRAHPLADLLRRLDEAKVRSRGGIMVPRSIDAGNLEPSAIIREPSRILIERAGDMGRTTSVVEVGRDLHVRLRESLWEDPPRIDLTSLIAFPAACLLFAKRFYEESPVDELRVVVGLANPQGRVLAVGSEFEGFWQSYVATSPVDLTVERLVTVDQLAEATGRLAIAREIATELVAYFGFDVEDRVWESHMNVSNTQIPGLSY